jgi:DHA1 family bicyclomycin/chloramphenicol resistance-like MFS transporter
MPKQMANDFMHVITNRRFALITAGGCLASTANYAYFASAPYILHDQLGVPLDLVGYYVGSTLIGAAVGTLSARYFVERIKIGTFVFWAGVCAVVNALAIVILAITGTISPLLVLILTFTQLLFAGAISPLALGTALSILPKMAGSASGVYGFLQMLTGAICTFLVGLGSNPAIACGSVLLACYALSFLLFHTVRSDARRASGHQ